MLEADTMLLVLYDPKAILRGADFQETALPFCMYDLYSLLLDLCPHIELYSKCTLYE